MEIDTDRGHTDGLECRLVLQTEPSDQVASDHTQTVLYVRHEPAGYRKAACAEVLGVAQSILHDRLVSVQPMSTPTVVREFLRLRLGGLEHEVFAMMLLDTNGRLKAYVELFRGTLTKTSVYPREVVKEALKHNAASVMFAHNHPSGSLQPSPADEMLTRLLKDALQLVDVRVMDHIIVSEGGALSFAEKGLI